MDGRLEGVAARVLTPMILGRAGTIERNDQAAIVRWATKTALVGMLLSSDRDRAAGYGVPVSGGGAAARRGLCPPAAGVADRGCAPGHPVRRDRCRLYRPDRGSRPSE